MATNGNDTIPGTSGADWLDGLDGNDLMYGNGGNDTMLGGNGLDTLYGGAGNDWLLGGAGNDLLAGEDGDDTLDGGAGQDAMFGGNGNDVYFVDHAEDGIFDSSGFDRVLSSVSYSLANATGAEELTLTGTGSISGTGNSLNNRLIGNSGANILNGGTGADYMQGLGGDDVYAVDNVGDTVVEASNAGHDTVLSSVSFNLNNAGAVEDLLLQGTAYSATGNSLNNYIVGNNSSNLIIGGGGNDTLVGGAGADTYRFAGASGSDRITETNAASTVDVMEFSSASYNKLWFKQVGNDLEVSVVGTSDKVAVTNWFSGTANQLDVAFDTGNAHALAASKVAGLVAVMANFAPQDLSSNATLTAARNFAWVTM